MRGPSCEMEPKNGEVDNSLASQFANEKQRKSDMLPASSSLFAEKTGDSGGQNVQVILRVRPLTLSYHSKHDGDGHQLVSQVLSEEQNLAQNRCIKQIINETAIVLHKSDE